MAKDAIWFPEPSTSDDSWATREEHTLDWLTRSSLPRAREARRFLNECMLALPADKQVETFKALRERWASAFFELIVLRYLHVLGAIVDIEVTDKRGNKPDFRAHFPDITVIVEAKSPNFTKVFGDAFTQQIPLLKIIEDRVPNGWNVGISELPNIGPADSKRQFTSVVARLFEPIALLEPLDQLELTQHFPNGTLRLCLVPARPNFRVIMWQPAVGGFDNSVEHIYSVVHHAKEQVRFSNAPVLLAINGSGTDTPDDFDKALFGHTAEWQDWNGNITKQAFIQDGKLTKNRQNSATYAGVLVFPEVGFFGGPDPILYLDPRFVGVLPQSLLGLEQRVFHYEANIIEKRPSQIEDLSEQIGFVPRDVPR